MHQPDLETLGQRRILSVSQLVAGVRQHLETEFRDVWVQGELSNFKRAPSGHCYFTLKDKKSQLRSVCFRLQAQYLRFEPLDGMEIVARGKLTLYENRGDFQMIVDFMEPVGQGALQRNFERLKTRLQAEGLFDPEQKKELPMLPARVGIVTSLEGAALQDMLRVLERRNRFLQILIFPVRVQGPQAAPEVARAIRYMGRRSDLDVVILGRGGGSLEDLWAFNDEQVARAIFASQNPVISAVGHETDVTIADFVADLRAATPSAAAEIVSRSSAQVTERVSHWNQRLTQSMRLLLARKKARLARLASSRAFINAETRMRLYQQRLDDLERRLVQTLPSALERAGARLQRQEERLYQAVKLQLERRQTSHQRVTGHLKAFSPQSVLERGFAIVTRPESGSVVRSAAEVAPGSAVDIQLADSRFVARRNEEE